MVRAMSLTLQTESIIDRVNESQKIEEIIRTNARNQTAHALLLWAETGYGKSAIMRKVKDNFANQPVRIVIVDTPPVNTTTPVEGQYLSYIAGAIDETIHSQFSLEKFLYSSQSHIQPLIDSDVNLQNGLSLKSGLINNLAQLGLTNLKSQRLLYDTGTDSILILKNYIEAAVQSTHVVLDITNAQNIDGTSFRVINDILQKGKDITAIFEYTTETQTSYDVVRFANQLRCSYTLMKIDSLPFDFALSIFGVPKDPNQIYQIEKFYNNIVKGNLYRIIQAKYDSIENNISLENDPIERKIRSLGYSSKLLLFILCLLDGGVEEEEFQSILDFIKPSFYIPDNWTDELSTLINLKNGSIILNHASIGDYLHVSSDNAAALAAYSYLEQYYVRSKTVERDSSRQQQAVVTLMKLYSKFAPSKILSILHAFKEIVIQKFSEQDALQLIRQAFDALGEKRETEYHFRLIALCYEAGFYQGALDLLKELGQPLMSECGQVFYCMLLNRNDFHEEAILCCDSIQPLIQNPRYQLIVAITKMLSERSLGLDKACRKTMERIRNNEKYQCLPEYGFYLRDTQLAMPYRESLPDLDKSIDLFNHLGEGRYAAQSKLTLAVQKARLGMCQEASSILDEISGVLLQTSFEKHIVYANHAAIRLLQGIADEKTMGLLDKALLTVTTVFDRVVVLNNMLCAAIIDEAISVDVASLLNKLISEIRDEPDLKLKRKVYTNIFLYYRMKHDTGNAEYWKREALRIGNKFKLRSIEDIFLLGIPPDDNLIFLSSQPCCVFFITYWHFDIPILGF